MEDPMLQHKLESDNHLETFAIHFFRSEAHRALAMRRRLDVTTGGAVVATGGVISFSLSSPDASHAILLANVFLIFVFVQVEARRYQGYARLKYRVRRMEKDYIAPLFNQIALPPKDLDYQPHMAPGLIDSLLDYKSPISRIEAIAYRMRRNYIYLLGLTYIIWFMRILNNYTDQPWLDYINQQARVSIIPGLAVFLLFTGLVLGTVIFTRYITKGADDYDALL